MIETLRDRSVIAACLVLYVLGMMMVTIGHSHAYPLEGNAQGDSVTYGVVCAVDGDTQIAPSHCPYCRLVDANFDMARSDVTLHSVTFFAHVVVDREQSVPIFDPSCAMPTRGPPLSV